MAKIRAYKLAEELKLDRDEFMKRAGEIGIQLKNHMVSLEDDQVAMIRQRLGGGGGGGVDPSRTEEKRLAGGMVIRRRRLQAPGDAPQTEASSLQIATPVGVESESSSGDELAVKVADSESTPDAMVADTPVAAPIAPQPAVTATPAVVKQPEATTAPKQAPGVKRGPAPIVPDPLEETAARTDAGRPAAAAPDAAGGAARRQVKRTVAQELNLREQDTMARTMLGNVQRRLEARRTIVENQSRLSPGRRSRMKSVARLQPGTAERKGPKVLYVAEEISFKEISRQTGLKVRDLWRKARAAGIECERDDKIGLEAVELIAADIGYEIEQVRSDIEVVEQQLSSAPSTEDSDLDPRPPVVTVMGHVDHGKTSLLDFIRKSNVVAGEAGGITQHVGAYSVPSGDSSVTFIDTPGHAAFTHMRARGAQVTDIVILVVAADDGVMPQTVEAIDHARAAGVPIIVAINKIDKGDANPQRVKQALLEHKLVVEDFGGETIAVEVSATKGTGIDKLLEMVTLQAEVLELTARSHGAARGFVVEAQLDRGRGPVATVLIREGQLERGDSVVIGTVSGRVRTMTDHLGQQMKKAGPSTSVQIVGLSGVPVAGDELAVVKNEREAKALVEHRVALERRSATEAAEGPGADNLFASLEGVAGKELRVVLKADVHGTMEAVREGIEHLATERVSVKIIHTGVGAVSESDVMLASASSAVIVGFHVRPEPAARKSAEQRHVDIRYFDIVYELFDQVKLMMAGLLPPKRFETVTGHARVKELFPIPKLGTIAGVQMAEGNIKRSNPVRVVRDGVPVYTGKLESLRRFRDDVREVAAPLECGLRVENFNDIKVGDLIESFQVEERPDTL